MTLIGTQTTQEWVRGMTLRATPLELFHTHFMRRALDCPLFSV
jgi:hypothetical protein